jgi:hypothetical protein
MGVVFCELGDRDRSKECYLASLKIRREHLSVKSVEVGIAGRMRFTDYFRQVLTKSSIFVYDRLVKLFTTWDRSTVSSKIMNKP